MRQVRRTRELQRAARRRAGKPVVAVVGYTTAGKSSLVAALSRQPVAARDRRAWRPTPRTRAAPILAALASPSPAAGPSRDQGEACVWSHSECA